MSSSDIDNQADGLVYALRQSIASRSILFCGSGFSASCKNVEGACLPTGGELLSLLNGNLDYDYKEIAGAAEGFKKLHGKFKLYELLRDTFKIERASQEVLDVLKFKWSAIYTTNYDNVIDFALTKNQQSFQVLNNTAKKEELKSNSRIPVIHLHGCAEKWDFKNNFDLSCVLDLESYHRISRNNPWIHKLREDYERAKYIFFVGFSNNDFYLRESLYGAEKKKDRVFFINSERDIGNKDLEIQQELLGIPCPIGLSEFAKMVEKTVSSGERPIENSDQLENFKEVTLPNLPDDRASAEEQENFVCYGSENINIHYKDIYDESSSYRIPREKTEKVLMHLEQEKSCCLISGSICCGKTTFLMELVLHLLRNGSGEIFYLVNKFDNIEYEIDKIFRLSSKPIFVIDDCFSSSSHWLENILKKIGERNARIILASRSLARDTEKSIEEMLEGERSFLDINLSELTSQEVNDLINYVDRIAGWDKKIPDRISRLKAVKQDNNRLSSVLISVFKSKHLMDKFKQSFELAKTGNPNLSKLIIMAMYLRSCGVNLNSEHLLSQTLGFDVYGMIPRTHQKNRMKGTEVPEWISVSSITGEVKTIASINARNSLNEIFEDKEIIDIIISAIENIQDLRYDGDQFYNIYRQLMRYTNLKHVINDANNQKAFFDRLSEFDFCKREVLFWLQYSIAMRENDDLIRAEQYLDQAYGKIKDNKDYITWQLDDQKAALLLDKAINLGLDVDIDTPKKQAEKFRYFQESSNLIEQLLKRRRGDQTPHAYQKILNLFPKFFEKTSKDHADIYLAILYKIKNISQNNLKELKHNNADDSYLGQQISNAITAIESCISVLEKDGK